nr:AraC family transcriptional regulator [Paracoccus methylarcula]
MLPTPSAGLKGPGPGLFTYCAFAHERLAEVRLPQPAVGVVLDGRKEIWLGDQGTVCPAGSAFVIPADTAMTVFNVPGEVHGLYRSLVIELADITPPEGGASTADTMRLTMTEPLRASLLHAAQALAQGPAAPAVRNARLTELVALIAHDPAGGWLGRASVSERLRRLLASASGGGLDSQCGGREAYHGRLDIAAPARDRGNIVSRDPARGATGRRGPHPCRPGQQRASRCCGRAVITRAFRASLSRQIRAGAI